MTVYREVAQCEVCGDGIAVDDERIIHLNADGQYGYRDHYPKVDGGVVVRSRSDLPPGSGGACEFCGEPSYWDDPAGVGEFAEPVDQADPDSNPLGVHKIGHAQCGIDAGWDLA